MLESRQAHDFFYTWGMGNSSKGRRSGDEVPCSACAELGERFHYSFPEDRTSPDPPSFAHLQRVADSVISFRNELVRCDQCGTHFAWDRMWDNDVYSTPLDYVDIYRLTPQGAKDWLKRESDWVRRERAAERRESRKLQKLWADQVAELGADERLIFEYLVQRPQRGQNGKAAAEETGLGLERLAKALAELARRKMLRKDYESAPLDAATYRIAQWRY